MPRTDAGEENTVRVERFDFSPLGRPSLTPQGFLKVPATITRVGILDYQTADGGTHRELRHPDEVLNEDSLASLQGAPLTELHKGMVTAKNVKDLQVGHVGEKILPNGGHVQAWMTVQAEDTIGKVKRRDLQECSAGYTCIVDMVPGEWNGQRYDGIQRNIRYNHVALGPKDWGRAGGEVKLHLDAAAALSAAGPSASTLGSFLRDRFSLLNMTEQAIADQLNAESWQVSMLMDGYSVPEAALLQRVSGLIDVPYSTLVDLIPVAARIDGGHQKRGRTMAAKIRIDGVEYDADSESFQQAFDQHEKRRADEKKALESKNSELQGRLDASEKKAEDLQKKLDEASDPARIDKVVQERADLVAKARGVLGADFDASGKTTRQIQEAVLQKLDEKLSLDGKDDAYVQGRFDHVIENQAAGDEPGRQDGSADVRRVAPTPKPRTDADGDGASQEHDKFDSVAARQRMLDRNQKLWQEPCSMSANQD